MFIKYNANWLETYFTLGYLLIGTSCLKIVLGFYVRSLLVLFWITLNISCILIRCNRFSFLINLWNYVKVHSQKNCSISRHPLDNIFTFSQIPRFSNFLFYRIWCWGKIGHWWNRLSIGANFIRIYSTCLY